MDIEYDWIPLKTFTIPCSKPMLGSFLRVVFFKFGDSMPHISDDYFQVRKTGASKSSGILIRSPNYKLDLSKELMLVYEGLHRGMKLYEFRVTNEDNSFIPLDNLNNESKILIIFYENP